MSTQFRPGDGIATPHRIKFEGGIKETWPRSGPTAEVLYECAWDDRYAFARELKGKYRTGVKSFIAYSVPHPYPPSPNMFCLDITSIEGIGAKKDGAGSKWSPYLTARVTAVYELPPYAVAPQYADSSNQIDPANPILWCTQKVKGSAAFRTLPEGKVKFATSGKDVTGSAGKPEAQAEVSLEFPHVPFNPYMFARPYLGKINTLPMLGHNVGEVLFDSIDIADSATFDGIEYAVGLALLCRNGATWNQLLNDDGIYETAVFKSTGNPLFASANLFDLFS